jgi:hypothetical protein
MTTIFKMANQEGITQTFEDMDRITGASLNNEDINITASLDEDGLSNEMAKIEKCASSGGNYAYNAAWSDSHVARLREYAAVVGFNGKMIAVTASTDSKETIEDDATMKRLADVPVNRPEASPDLRLAVADPYLLVELQDAPETKDKWETVNPERKLASAPDQTARMGSITPIRGEFEYEKQQQLRVRKGENSLANPDAIGKLSQEEDTGERLKAENANHKAERKAAKSAWETETVMAAKASGVGALSRGNVFMTASIPEKKASSGLELDMAVIELSKMNAPTIPDLQEFTDGEKLHTANVDRKSNIQRKASTDNWQLVKGSKRPSLDDDFANALEFQMKKAGIKLG